MILIVMSRVFARHYPDMFFNLLSLVTKNVTTMPCLRHELELVGFTGVDHLTVWSPKNIEKKIRTDATFQPECCHCLFSNTYTILYYQTQNQQVNPSKTTRKNQQMNPSKKIVGLFYFFLTTYVPNAPEHQWHVGARQSWTRSMGGQFFHHPKWWFSTKRWI